MNRNRLWLLYKKNIVDRDRTRMPDFPTQGAAHALTSGAPDYQIEY